MNNPETIKNYCGILDNSLLIALATSADGLPNVRLVNFVYKEDRPDLIYFASDRGDAKVAEFAANCKIAFTTIPDGNDGNVAHVRSRGAAVSKSALSIDDVKDLFLAKVPGYGEALDAIGRALDVFEIKVGKAAVITGFEEPPVVAFE